MSPKINALKNYTELNHLTSRDDKNTNKNTKSWKNTKSKGQYSFCTGTTR